MSPDSIGAIIGIFFILPTIYIVQKKEMGAWVWPLFLTTLPIYYMLFGLIVMDHSAILKELLFGLPYFLTGLLAWRVKSPLTHYVLALAWLSHGFYDYYHDLFFVNSGVFDWYPAFCLLIDIAVAAYLLIYPSIVKTQKV